MTKFDCIIFVIFTSFHLTNIFVEEKCSWLPSKNKVADEKTDHYNLTRKCKFSSVTLFLEGIICGNITTHRNRNTLSESISLHCIYQLDRDGIFCKSSRSSYAQPHALPSIFVDDQIKFANWQLLASDHESYC